MKIKKLSLLLIIAGVLAMLGSCTAVKEYEKVNLNDPDMELASRSNQRFENAFQAYREAAAGANGGKVGGGCGCN